MLTIRPDTLRERVDALEVQNLLDRRVLVVEEHRRRPRYFDGRFLAARDLTRDQSYFLARQSATARAVGSGVVEGLEVGRGGPTTLTIGAGFGFTPSGELVSVPQPLQLDLADAARLQLLRSAFGRSRRPGPVLRNRFGIFALVLRPVEFTANPIAAYPSDLEARRTVEDGDIVEAAVASLLPVADVGADEIDARRAGLARQVFVGGEPIRLSPEVLPLALVALAGDTVRWIDPHLVRREVGAAHADILGFGFAPRMLREAHLAQYREQLEVILAASGGQRFPAAQHFEALPPAGPLPKACVNTQSFSQNYFPAQVNADLSLLPEDELPALIEESFLLPPIDLRASAEEFESMAVTVLVPVERARLRTLAARLSGSLQRPLPSPTPELVLRRLPLDLLKGIRPVRVVPPLVDPQAVIDNLWRQTVAEAGSVWYARRRSFAYREEWSGTPLRILANDLNVDLAIRNRLEAVGLTTRVDALQAKLTPTGRAELTNLLSSSKFDQSSLLLQSAVKELEAAPALDAQAVLAVSEQFSRPGVGEGLARLEATNPDLLKNATTVKKLVDSGSVSELDALSARLSDRELTNASTTLAGVLKRTKTDDVPVVVRRAVLGRPL